MINQKRWRASRQYTQFYVHIHEILVRKKRIVNTIATSKQLVQFVISSLPIRLVHGGISQSRTRTRTPRETLDEIGSTVDRHFQQITSTGILCTVGHIYTVNKKSDNIQFTRLREFIELWMLIKSFQSFQQCNRNYAQYTNDTSCSPLSLSLIHIWRCRRRG